MEVIRATMHNALTGSPSVDWTRKSAQAREKVNQQFIAKRHLSSVSDVKRALRAKYELAGPIDRGPAFRRTVASCGGKLDLAGWRHFLNLSGIYVSNPPGRDIVRELWESKRGSNGVIEFPVFAELCFGNEPIISDMGREHKNETFKLNRAKNRMRTQDAQADLVFKLSKPDHFKILRDKLQRRGKQSFSEKFAMLQLLASYKEANLKKDGFALALKKIGMRLTPEEYEDMFTACDLNRDGEIDFKEFCAVIMGAPGYHPDVRSKRRPLNIASKRERAFVQAEAAQRAAERGHHLIKTVNELKEKVRESFSKLNTGSSAASSFRRLKQVAGAVIDAVQFAGFMKYIKLYKIPAEPHLVKKLFDKMLKNTRAGKNKKKTAFTLLDFTIEFFGQQSTSAFQEDDHLYQAQMDRIRAREKAQHRAKEEMADRLGVFLDPNAPIAGGPLPSSLVSQRSARQSALKTAGRSVVNTPPQLPQPARQPRLKHRFQRTGEAQPVKFSALPNPHLNDTKILNALSSLASNANTMRTQRTQNSRRSSARQAEIPKQTGRHTRADPRISMQLMLRKKGIRADRRDVSRLLEADSVR